MVETYKIDKDNRLDFEWDFQEARDKCLFGKCDVGRCNLFLSKGGVDGDYTKCMVYLDINKPLK